MGACPSPEAGDGACTRSGYAMNAPSQVLLQKGLQLLHDLVVDASPAREQEIVHLLLPRDA